MEKEKSKLKFELVEPGIYRDAEGNLYLVDRTLGILKPLRPYGEGQ